MRDIMKTLQDWWLVGVIVGLATKLTSILWGKYINTITLKFATPSLEFNVRDRILNGMDTTWGEKIWGYLQGYVPVSANMTSWIVAAISGVVIVLIGVYLYDFLYHGRNAYQKVTLVALYGTIASMLIFKMLTPALSWDILQLIVTIGIYWAVMAAALMVVFKWMDMSVPN